MMADDASHVCSQFAHGLNFAYSVNPRYIALGRDSTAFARQSRSQGSIAFLRADIRSMYLSLPGVTSQNEVSASFGIDD